MEKQLKNLETKPSVQCPRGMRDFFPHQKRKLDSVKKVMTEISQLFSYQSYDGPLLEEVQLYRAKSGDELVNQQLYFFTDRGGREMAIRPEMTPSLARMVAQIHREYPRPIRWFSIPNLLRYERPQRGRLREHWQWNVDIFGAPEFYGELEILELLVSFFQKFSATPKDVKVRFSHRGLIDFLCQNILELSSLQSTELTRLFDKAKKISPEALSAGIEKIESNEKKKAIVLKFLDLKTLEDCLSFLEQYKRDGTEKISILLKGFSDLFKDLPWKEYLQFDPTIVRGLDYYTGLVFEAFDEDPANPRAICGGGSYSNLINLFEGQGQTQLSGVGLGMGDVTLVDFLEQHQLIKDHLYSLTDIYLCPISQENLASVKKIASQLRNIGLKTEVEFKPTRPRKAFEVQKKKKIPLMALIGDEEEKAQSLEIHSLFSDENKKTLIHLTDESSLILKMIEEGRKKNDRT